MSTFLIYPMVFYVFYMFGLAAYLFRTRLRAVKSGEVHIKYFKSYTGQPPTDRTQLVGRHFDNQFQVPLLFFAACILHLVLGQAGAFTLALAWLFVATRLVHSWIHLGRNQVHHRVMAFSAGWLAILLLWAQLALIAMP